MENATKALLIAAAILITIIIISIGIAVVNQGQEAVGRTSTSLNEAETAAFNAPFELYANGQKNASDIRRLISSLESHNAKEESSGDKRLIGIYYTDPNITANDGWYGPIPKVGTSALSKLEDTNRGASISDYDTTKKALSELTSKVVASKTYKVEGFKSSISLYYAFRITAK